MTTDVLATLKADYSRFPRDQTYSIYADNVYFKDPVFQFRGLALYKRMIGFIQTFFGDCQMDLHNIQQEGNRIRSDWTLSWNSPLPWKPRIAIAGWSELAVNEAGLIGSHIDHWNCSRLDVIRQHFPRWS